MAFRQIKTPALADQAVINTKLDVTSVSGQTELASLGAVSADMFLVYDSSADALKKVSATNILGSMDTDALAEGSSNLYYTDARVETKIDTYVLGGTGVDVTGGEISIGQDVATTADVTFGTVTSGDVTAAAVSADSVETTGNIIVGGDLTVRGTTTTVDSTTVQIGDNIIELNKDATSGTVDAGISVVRGTDGDKSFIWNEADDRWSTEGEQLAVSTLIGAVLGDVTGTVSDISNHDTDALAEGSNNLYYTTARANTDFDTRLATKTADDVAEGSTNFYYTEAKFDASLATKTTDDVTEGDNLYYTDSRVNSVIAGTSIGDLVDVDISDITAGNTVVWNGTSFETADHFDTADFNTGFAAKTTDDLAEGTGSLYFTADRAKTAVAADIATAKSEAIAAAAADATTKADAAEADAIAAAAADATTKADQALVDAKAYTDTREVAITTAYESYADTAEADAKAYADTQDATLLQSAKDYADAQDTAQTALLEAYADTAEADAIAAAATDATTKADQALVDAKAYADQAELDAIAASNTYTDTAVAAVVDSAPELLDTLNELAEAIGDDANFATTMTNNLAGKLSLTGGTMSGDINTGGNTVTGLAVPAAASDAATKGYVDGEAQTINNTIDALTTDEIAEGDNLYYTDTRSRAALSGAGDIAYNAATGVISVTTYKSADFDTDLATKSTDDLAEGSTNLYWTEARGDANFAVNLAASTTDDVAEGSTNLYWTEARFDASFGAKTINDLSDINAAGTPNNGDALRYNADSQKWEIGAVASSIMQLTDVTDTDYVGKDGYVLVVDDSEDGMSLIDASSLAFAQMERVTLNGDGAQTSFSLGFTANDAYALVFVGGVIQDPSAAYTITGSSITFTAAIPAGTQAVVINHGVASMPSIMDGQVTAQKLGANVKAYVQKTAVTAGTGGNTVDAFDSSSYRSAKYIIQVANAAGTEFETREALVVHDGSNAYITEYALVYTGSALLGDASVTMSGTDVNLVYTAASADSTVKVIATYIDA